MTSNLGCSFFFVSSDPSSLGEICREAVLQITEAEVCEEVHAAILESLKEVKGLAADFQNSHFAVRSSAAGKFFIYESKFFFTTFYKLLLQGFCESFEYFDHKGEFPLSFFTGPFSYLV